MISKVQNKNRSEKLTGGTRASSNDIELRLLPVPGEVDASDPSSLKIPPGNCFTGGAGWGAGSRPRGREAVGADVVDGNALLGP